MTDHSYTGKKIEIVEFFSWEEKLQSQTEQIKAKAPTQPHCKQKHFLQEVYKRITWTYYLCDSPPIY